MKVTRSWLENYIEITNTTDELCHDLTMAGLEVDFESVRKRWKLLVFDRRH